MVEVNAIGIPSQSPSPRSDRNRSQPVHATHLVSTDAIEISEEAKKAAEHFRLALRSAAESELRKEMVASAKQRVLEGSHRIRSVVTQVASRLSPFI